MSPMMSPRIYDRYRRITAFTPPIPARGRRYSLGALTIILSTLNSVEAWGGPAN